MVVRRERGKMHASLQSMTTRPAAVAGQFYAGDPDQLRTQILQLFADVEPSANARPKALIAPHAGYVYSGRIAAAAFATLRDIAQTITRVVLIGPAHYLHVHGIAAPTVDAFETPLGRVPIDVRRCTRFPTCHLSFAPMLRMRPSTLSKWSCRSCNLSWGRSE